MKLPAFANKSELFKFLKENKAALIAEKKYSIKHGDCVQHIVLNEDATEPIIKSISKPEEFTGKEVKASVVINTTNIMDSHNDVHLPGLWSKSLKETKLLYLLEEHKMSFRNIISDDVKATTKTFTWKELGYDAPGTTQALVFITTIDKTRNEYMFDQYLKGRVKNHSVGMNYVKLDLALNSDERYDQVEREVWYKYINEIVNKEQVEAQGFFWAVTEAKVIEGSAVPIGSNIITPVLSLEEKDEPPYGTHKKIEPGKPTQINYESLLKKFN